MAVAAVALSGAALGAKADLLDWPIAAALMILALGVPHGAFDAALAHRRYRLDSPRRLAGFVVIYVAIAMLVVLAWIVLPAVALCAFLAYSALHFADDWASDVEGLPRLVLGVALVSLPAVGHPEQVSAIFGWIAPREVAEAAASGLQLAGLVAANAGIVIIVATALRAPSAALEIAAVLALAAVMPPLTFFLLYFCLMHSVRHTLDMYERLRPDSPLHFTRMALPYALAAVAGTIAGGLLLFRLEPGEALLSAVFIALAALTVPHMLLETQIGGTQRGMGDAHQDRTSRRRARRRPVRAGRSPIRSP